MTDNFGTFIISIEKAMGIYHKGNLADVLVGHTPKSRRQITSLTPTQAMLLPYLYSLRAQTITRRK